MFQTAQERLYQGFIQQILEKGPDQNWEKIIDLMSKLGKIIDIKHNYGSKIYPKNQVISFVCLIWFFTSHQQYFS